MMVVVALEYLEQAEHAFSLCIASIARAVGSLDAVVKLQLLISD